MRKLLTLLVLALVGLRAGAVTTTSAWSDALATSSELSMLAPQPLLYDC